MSKNQVVASQNQGTDRFSSPAYRKSKVSYHIQCLTEYFVGLMMQDAFLAKLLKDIGLSDSTIGIVSSLISLAFLVQLLTIFLLRYMKNVKLTVVVIDMLSVFLFMGTYIIPFIPVALPVKTLLVFICVGGGYLSKNLILNVYYKWGYSFVDPAKRGKFTARNETISTVGGIVFSLAMGYIVDQLQKDGNLSASFIFIAAVIAVLSGVNLVTLLMIKKPEEKEALSESKKFSKVIKNTLGNKLFRNVIIMSASWEVARYLTFGFLGTFKTQELAMTVGFVQIINTVSYMLRSLIAPSLGRLSDKTSYAKVFRLGAIIVAAGFLCCMFTTEKTWWLIIAFTLLYNVGISGIGGNTNNMTYSFVPQSYFVQAQAIRSSIGGVLGFLASLLGSRILAAIQANGNQVFGIHMYGQQLLSGCSLILMIFAILWNFFVVSKQKSLEQAES